MTSENFAKSYDPKPVEEKWYAFWEKRGFFKADENSSKPPYTIIMPPPNVTGILHMGHGLVDSLQDILIRWKRMCGFEALWLPGTDHAGISTQTVVERHLIATTGKRRKDFSREEFLAHVWDWKEKSQSHILHQIRKVGCSCDWDRLKFTMDEPSTLAVREMFKKLYDDNLIYRGDYLVNWDPITQTALADDEVEYEDKKTFLWHLRYPIENQEEFIIIATTRPETMLGDTAVAVSPKDSRYAHLIGKRIVLPLVGRLIPIIADPFVDPQFGTGAVKITPAHDPNDFEMALRHNLPMINIMTPDAKINEVGGKFAGLTMEKAREKISEELLSLGLLEKKEPYSHRVGVSYRSKAIIEPYLSKQWFVKMTAFKDKLIDAVKRDEVKIVPDHWKSTYFHWIENLRDWCISRQLWWGHQIPIWYHKLDASKILCWGNLGIPPEVEEEPDLWQQDEDVLDTWFSSALWPFSTLGWPKETADLKKFYPTSVLVTGHDILFFWVARMIMMGQYALCEVPFDEAFIHGLIYGKSYWREKEGEVSYVSQEERLRYEMGETPPPSIFSKWEKMSKSKGNVIDPIEMIDLYGADAVRFTLASMTTYARQIDLDRRRFEESKNFINKIWNGARFLFLNLTGDENLSSLTSHALEKGIDRSLLALEDRWLLSLLNKMIKEVNSSLKDYHFDKAATALYEFFWNQFCAYYLELAKPILFGKQGNASERENKQKLLLITLMTVIRAMHPFIPFITEELFTLLKEKFPNPTLHENIDPYTDELLRSFQSEACIIAPYPQKVHEADIDDEMESTFRFMSLVTHAIRNLRGEMGIPPSLATAIYIFSEKDSESLRWIQTHEPILRGLVRIENIHFAANETNIPSPASLAMVDNIKIFIPLPSQLKEKEFLRLQKEKEKLSNQLEGLNSRLSNPEFKEKAPQALVLKTEEQRHTAQSQLEKLNELLEKFT